MGTNQQCVTIFELTILLKAWEQPRHTASHKFLRRLRHENEFHTASGVAVKFYVARRNKHTHIHTDTNLQLKYEIFARDA